MPSNWDDPPELLPEPGGTGSSGWTAAELPRLSIPPIEPSALPIELRALPAAHAVPPMGVPVPPAATAPLLASDALAAGYSFFGAGELEFALQCFDRAWERGSDPEVQAARGEVLLAMSRPGPAITAWSLALALDPANVRYLLGFGEAALVQEDLERARAAVAEALRLRPDSTRAHLLMARTLARQGELSGAIIHYHEAIYIDSGARDPLYELGVLLLDNERESEGITVLERCTRSHPDDGPCLYHLGRAWYSLLEVDRARQFLSRYLEIDPDDALGGALLSDRIDQEVAALQAGQTSLPRTYVRALFDQYADRFDENLRSRLGYHAPELLRGLIEPFLAERNHTPLDILDLGCGTGLSGEPFRGVARELHGVDLSPAMIEQAAKLGIYDVLRAADVRDVLLENRSRWDLILACDTLVYMADLSEVFASVSGALRPGGAWVATVEAPEDDSEVQFKSTRRFGHAQAYLERLAAQAGLIVRAMQPSAVRRERGRPVSGFVFLLARPHSDT